MFLLFYLLLSVESKRIIKSKYDINYLYLPTINNNYLDTDKTLDLDSRDGMCQINFNEIPIETIYDIHFKNKLLNVLLDENVSIFQKLELIEEYDYIFTKKDDILDDWNFIF